MSEQWLAYKTLREICRPQRRGGALRFARGLLVLRTAQAPGGAPRPLKSLHRSNFALRARGFEPLFS